MATFSTIYNFSLFSVVPQVNVARRLTGISVITDQLNVRVSLGYVGDQTEKDLAMDFTEILDLRDVVVKSWTNKDKTVLKAVAVFSKYRKPFHLIVEMRNTPPLDKFWYIDTLAGSDPITETYAVLTDYPKECPMVPEVEITKRFGRTRVPSENGLIDLRKEITHRVTQPVVTVLL